MLQTGKVDQDYPIYGDGITRNSITHLFNIEILKIINDFPKLKFITLFYDLIDENLITNVNALHDSNHLSISHYPHARNLLETVTTGTNKAAFNIQIFNKIKYPQFNCRPLESESLSYITNSIFQGNSNFKFFTNLNFFTKKYKQLEIILRPGIENINFQDLPQLGTYGFLDLFFQGYETEDFMNFERIKETFNSTGKNFFDSENYTECNINNHLSSHYTQMLRRLNMIN